MVLNIFQNNINLKSVCGMIGYHIISGEYFEKDFMFWG